MMRKAFRVTEVSGDPDPAKQRFYMRFSFPSIEALHAADDEWKKFIAAAPAEARELALTQQHLDAITAAIDMLERRAWSNDQYMAAKLRELIAGGYRA
ncbi:hypothetical protein UA18_03479 [Burkholderia multivorans]|nr:hypothetical protein [Burkholderia multivorans]SAJ96698.1 hypothetical protein UA18_03479 [Burkholderia multivorans]